MGPALGELSSASGHGATRNLPPIRALKLQPAAKAQAAWREEIAFAGQFTRDHDLDFAGRDSEGEPVSLRELLVHMIEEGRRRELVRTAGVRQK